MKTLSKIYWVTFWAVAVLVAVQMFNTWQAVRLVADYSGEVYELETIKGVK